MCGYCENVFTGDSTEDLLFGNISVNGVDVGDIDVYLTSTSYGKPVPQMVLMMDCGKLQAPVYKTLNVNYCPVCGSKLIKEGP